MYHQNGLTDTGMLHKMIGGRTAFSRFMMQQDDAVYMESDSNRINDAQAISIMLTALNITNGTQLQQLERKCRDEALVVLKEKGLTIRQIERLTGINRGIIQKAK